jgi:hypothetical protein
LTFWPGFNPVTVVTPAGTVQSQFPILAKVRIVSPFEDVVVGEQAAAFAGTGIETKRLVRSIVETIVAIFGRAASTFMRNKPKNTFTSLLE